MANLKEKKQVSGSFHKIDYLQIVDKMREDR